MIDFSNGLIPKEAIQSLKTIMDLFGNNLVGVYLYGSAVMGGLHADSDIDLLILTEHRLTKDNRKNLADGLMLISGKLGNKNGLRPLEVTVINIRDIVPWHYPAKHEFLYGEWLRTKIEAGNIPQPKQNPDLAILIAQARKDSINLFGPEAIITMKPIPEKDIKRAISESLPGLISNIKGDERNIILTLARMWLTASTGEIISKDMAAEWAIPRLPKDTALLFDLARKGYLGECVDKWQGKEAELTGLIKFMKMSIESCLGIGASSQNISNNTV